MPYCIIGLLKAHFSFDYFGVRIKITNKVAFLGRDQTTKQHDNA